MPYKDHKKQIECVNKRQDKLRRQLYAIKEASPCVDCNKQYPHYVMEFDHIRGDKKFGISKKGASFGSKAFKEEIAKCELVCSNCHAERTHKRLKKCLCTVL